MSFDFNVYYSSGWGYSLINTLKLKRVSIPTIFFTLGLIKQSNTPQFIEGGTGWGWDVGGLGSWVRLPWLAHDEAPGPYITIPQYRFNKTKQHTHAESFGEDPRATGDLVSNLPHPRVNKTEHHTFALRHSNDCIVRCLPEKRYNRRTSSSGEEPWPVVAGSVFYILVQRSCTSFLSDSGGGNHCFWQALWVHCTEIHRSETPPTPCYYLLLLSQSVLTRHGG